MDNLRGAVFMVIAMLGFAIEDMLIKQMVSDMPTGQVIILIGIGGAIIFAISAWVNGDALFTRAALHPAILMRTGFEMIGTLGFVSAITLIPLSTASAILQATPLIVTLGAAIFLGETVGWRRWVAIMVGLSGVLLILRPGLDGFDAMSLFAVLGVLGLAARDICTKIVPRAMSTQVIAFYAFIFLIPTGLILLAIGLTGDSWQNVSLAQSGKLALAIIVGVFAYYAVIGATRTGDVAIVSPFRYSRLVFALIIGILAFDERPDAMVLIGAFIIVASGIYTLWRESKLRTSPSQQAGL
jgi:drug/metabolite transporter (DMT)-like permease